MKLQKLKDCSKCIYSTSYGSKDSPRVDCKSSNYDVRQHFKEYGRYCASRCAYFKEKGILRDGFVMDNYMDVMLGGNSSFILHSTKTEQDFEYKIQKVTSNIDDVDYLYYLTIRFADDEVYAGTIYFDNRWSKFKFSQGSRGKVESSDISIKSLLHVLNKLYNGEEVQYLEIMHTGTCSVCGKVLEDEDSIRTGVHKQCMNALDYPRVVKDF